MHHKIIDFLHNPAVKQGIMLFMILSLLTSVGLLYAQDMTIGTVATNVTGTFEAVSKLITATSYVAGLGFSIGAMLKFKQHKDNPTQIPIGTPIAMLFIAAAWFAIAKLGF